MKKKPRIPSGVAKAASARNSAGRMTDAEGKVRDRRNRRPKDARRDETRQEW